eukprot:1208354-Prymnesium_polylepis.1
MGLGGTVSPLGWRGVEHRLKPHDNIENRYAHKMRGHGGLCLCRRRTGSGAAKLWVDERRRRARRNENRAAGRSGFDGVGRWSGRAASGLRAAAAAAQD